MELFQESCGENCQCVNGFTNGNMNPDEDQVNGPTNITNRPTHLTNGSKVVSGSTKITNGHTNITNGSTNISNGKNIFDEDGLNWPTVNLISNVTNEKKTPSKDHVRFIQHVFDCI